MFVATLFAAVSAADSEVLPERSASWGGFAKSNCKTIFPKNAEKSRDCLIAIRGNGFLGTSFGAWKEETCEASSYLQMDEGKDSTYCVSNDKEVLTCCGNQCQGEPTDGKCSEVGGLSEAFIADYEGECTPATDDAEDSCMEFSALIKTATGQTVELVCQEDQKCAPKKKVNPNPVAPAEPNGNQTNEATAKPSSGAFAMGLSTLAGALVILQL